SLLINYSCVFFQAEDGIRDRNVTGVQTCALPILLEWQLNDTLEETIDNNIDYLHWKEILKLFIYEIDAHKRYYYECLTVQTEVNVADIFATHLVVLLAHVLERQELISNKKAQDNMWI